MYNKLQIGKLVKTWCLVVVVFDIPVVCIDLPGTANLRIQGVPQKITHFLGGRSTLKIGVILECQGFFRIVSA